MEVIHFLSIEDVEYFYEEEMIVAGTKGWIRDKFELEACIEAPKHSFNCEYLLDIYGMAAKYITSFAIRHPYSDGNKRVGTICAVVFLEANGIDYRESTETELADVIYQYLRKEIDETGLASHLRTNSKQQ
jgi:death-on-curing protein